MRPSAYDIILSIDTTQPLNPQQFSQLITDFERNLMSFYQYHERIAKHRQPTTVKSEIYQLLCKVAGEIQNRPEMLDVDPLTRNSSYTPTIINDLWRADKYGKTLYNAVLNYCNLRSKDFNTVAVHIAEYRAVNRLIYRINRSINKKSLALNPKEFQEMAKRIQEVDNRRSKSKIYCYKCNGETRQVCLYEKGEIIPSVELVAFDEQGYRKESAWAIEARVWKIYQCQGCESINLNVYSRHSPLEDDQLIHHFPPRDFRPFPRWATHLQKDYLELICEIYQSLSLGIIRLPLMGARTLLDLYMVEKVGDVGPFEKKLQKLVDGNFISSTSKALLEVALEYGHAAIHRNYQPTQQEMNDVLDIIENLLQTEALSDKTKDLKKNVPKHKR
jgi:hypothetical protein